MKEIIGLSKKELNDAVSEYLTKSGRIVNDDKTISTVVYSSISSNIEFGYNDMTFLFQISSSDRKKGA